MKIFLFVIFIISALSWSGFGFIIWTVPPKIDDQLAITNFLYALALGFTGLWGTFTLLIYLVTNIFKPKTRITEAQPSDKKIIWSSIRRSLLISSLAAGLITLNVFELLNILNVVLLAGILILIEIYFSSR